MEQPLIRDIYAQWKDAKQQAQKECENRSLFNMAEKYRVCSMFKGTETLEQVLKLFSSPQGIEFARSVLSRRLKCAENSKALRPKTSAFISKKT